MLLDPEVQSFSHCLLPTTSQPMATDDGTNQIDFVDQATRGRNEHSSIYEARTGLPALQSEYIELVGSSKRSLGNATVKAPTTTVWNPGHKTQKRKARNGGSDVDFCRESRWTDDMKHERGLKMEYLLESLGACSATFWGLVNHSARYSSVYRLSQCLATPTLTVANVTESVLNVCNVTAQS